MSIDRRPQSRDEFFERLTDRFDRFVLSIQFVARVRFGIAMSDAAAQRLVVFALSDQPYRMCAYLSDRTFTNDLIETLIDEYQRFDRELFYDERNRQDVA